MSTITPLPLGVGYGVVVGIGFFFAALMCGISYIQVGSALRTIPLAHEIQNRFTRYSTKTSEEFNTASRSVKPGLIASGIVSAWTWAASKCSSGCLRVVLYLNPKFKMHVVHLSPMVAGLERFVR